jgi:DNA polymerase III subunit delta
VPTGSPPPVRLLTGPVELLLRRAADQLLDELRGGGELEVEDVRAGDLRDGGLPDVWTGSLFGTPRAIVIREAQDLPSATGASLIELLSGPVPAATVILLATATGRIQKLAKAVKAAGGRTDVAPPRDWEDRKWAGLVHEEFRRHQRTPDDTAVDAILAHAGLDVHAVAEKVAQVAAAAPEGTITRAHVDDLVVGVGNRGAFAVADAMCDREPEEALTLLRGAFAAGEDPVKVLGALVYRLRAIVAVAGGLDGKTVGVSVSPGQARRLKSVRRNFGPGELTSAYARLAAADLEIKSGELPPELVMERAVVEVATRA